MRRLPRSFPKIHNFVFISAAADADGMMVSLIQSIFNPFGSALVVPGAGFALQSRGAGFALDAAHANGYQPGKRPFHTIMPGFALKDGRPWLAFGVMGADMQPQGQVQILANLIDLGDDVACCALRPRLRHAGGAQPNGVSEPGVGTIFVEPEMPARVTDGLRARGHEVVAITMFETAAQLHDALQAIDYAVRQNLRNLSDGAPERRAGDVVYHIDQARQD